MLVFIQTFEIMFILFLISCTTPNVSISYHYSTETSFFGVDINGSTMIYTHLDEDKIREKCSTWIQQAPCWDAGDLVSEAARLTPAEVADLDSLVMNTKNMESYSGPDDLRCYPHILVIDGREMTYCSRPDGPSEPEAFALITEKIELLVSEKFG